MALQAEVVAVGRGARPLVEEVGAAADTLLSVLLQSQVQEASRATVAMEAHATHQQLVRAGAEAEGLEAI